MNRKFNKKGSGFGTEETIILILALAVLAVKFVAPEFTKIKNSFSEIISQTTYWIGSSWFLLILIVIFLVYSINKLHKRIKNSIRINKYRISKAEEEKSEIDTLLNTNLNAMKKEDIYSFLKKLDSFNFVYTLTPEIKERFKTEKTKAKNKIIELEHEKEIEWLESRKYDLENRIKELKREKYLAELGKEDDRKDRLKTLGSDWNAVFKKSNLSKMEVEALLKEGYKQTNEYCVKENKVITVLVKPYSNHSLTHTFLVWSVKKLLEEYPKITSIKEFLTRGADLTFRIKGRDYAIEIETGNILRKSAQFREKLGYMNSNYQNRWIFIVSHRKFLQKFKKFAKSCQRKEVRKNIEKWLKN